MNIELKSKWAFLDVSCYNKDADIYIDGIKQSQGEWQGKIISGTHTIETKRKYHKSERKTVTLRPEENRSVYINPLDRNTSTGVIKYSLLWFVYCFFKKLFQQVCHALSCLDRCNHQ